MTIITTFSQKNVAKSNYIDNTPNADVCVQYETSAIIIDTFER
ncbi:DUF3172 domain-containing protein [Nostoc sphaeroides]|uniref:Uncharacterized protein n=1 Tax=Nostoc sphaeroides CCNUC1 TaxID=2653204 RepID=A0A5P8WB79_9NOSO|nr:hypothetical protein GXM_06653 [Nostoc sphaeroides CCNUC1]